MWAAPELLLNATASLDPQSETEKDFYVEPKEALSGKLWQDEECGSSLLIYFFSFPES